MTADPVRAIADAVLYEGYILWPYRRSALKNQQRFTFGGVYPPAHTARHPDDLSLMRSEVLLIGEPDVELSVTVRFLHVVKRTIFDGDQPADELTVDGQRYLSWEEAAEREVATTPASLRALQAGVRQPIEIDAGEAAEPLAGSGVIVRTWKALAGEVSVGAGAVSQGVWRLSVQIDNTTWFAHGTRAEALEQTLCSTHALLHCTGGEFVSLADPPDELAPAAARCRNVGCWPVLVENRRTMLCSPIILEDYPRIAPESPGDLFDGGEIDQLLILNILALTDEEKAEMAASDPRAREILERTQALTPEQMLALHGTIREFGLAR